MLTKILPANGFVAATVLAYRETGLSVETHNPLQTLVICDHPTWRRLLSTYGLNCLVKRDFPNGEWREGFLEGWEGPYERTVNHGPAWEAGYKLGVAVHRELIG